MFYIRKALVSDAEAIAKVHVQCWQTTYQTLVEKEYLKSLRWEDRLSKWQIILKDEKLFYFVALLGEEVIGFIGGGSNRTEPHFYDAELYAIYLLKNFQGKGLGRQLFSTLVDELIRQQFHFLIVWVAEENSAKNFYTHLGAQLTSHYDFHQLGPTKLKVIAYAWDLKKFDIPVMKNRDVARDLSHNRPVKKKRVC